MEGWGCLSGLLSKGLRKGAKFAKKQSVLASLQTLRLCVKKSLSYSQIKSIMKNFSYSSLLYYSH
jgi:hypothetical protein